MGRPKGSGKKLINFPPTFCIQCGSQLKHKSLLYYHRKKKPPLYCSISCYSMANDNSLAEPQTAKQVESFYNAIKERTAALKTEHHIMLEEQSPSDDSPQAEIELRKTVCPNPIDWHQGGTRLPRKDPIILPQQSKGRYRE